MLREQYNTQLAWITLMQTTSGNYWPPQTQGWLRVILQERFGLSLELVIAESGGAQLTLPGSEKLIHIAADSATFTLAGSDLPCTQWDAAAEGWKPALDMALPAPGAQSLVSPLIEQNDSGHVIHYDILGLTYWMLTRQEEVGRTDLDEYQRFPATSSHAYKHGYLERPVVDEWLDLLGQVIQRTWPDVELKQHQFSVKVSHDVDQPSAYGFKTWPRIARVMAGHVVKRRDIKALVTTPYVKCATRRSLCRVDPKNTFDWLMDLSEANGLQSAFYFICGRTYAPKDAEYEPEHPAIRALMRNIHQRGHEIGLHPSYGCYQRPDLIRQEAERLQKICAEEGIRQPAWGGRMHYLRWEQPTTLQAWEDAGMAYDTTLSYADRPGFRCGTCFEYPAFNPVTGQQLELRIRPLVAMECTVIDEQYLGLGEGTASLQKMQELKTAARKVNGCFTLLWHNSYFTSAVLADMYAQVIS